MQNIEIIIPEDADEQDVEIIQKVLDTVPEIALLSEDGIDAMIEVLYQVVDAYYDQVEADKNQYE